MTEATPATPTIPASTLTYDFQKGQLSDGRKAVHLQGEVDVFVPQPGIGNKAIKKTDQVVQLLVENTPGATGSDLVTMFTCLRGCGVFLEANSVVAHMSHHDRPEVGPSVGAPRYPEETIKLVLRTAKQLKHDGVRNYCEATAEQLNERGVPTYQNGPVNGGKWTSQSVSTLLARYSDVYSVRLLKRRNITAQPAIDVESFTDAERQLFDTFRDFQRVVDAVDRGLEQLQERMLAYMYANHRREEELGGRPNVTDEELAELRRKAAKWEAFVALRDGD